MSRNTEETQRGDVAKGNERPEWSDGGREQTHSIKGAGRKGGKKREAEEKSTNTEGKVALERRFKWESKGFGMLETTRIVQRPV